MLYIICRLVGLYKDFFVLPDLFANFESEQGLTLCFKYGDLFGKNTIFPCLQLTLNLVLHK